jgi:rhodanese-related sulfurtransferase
MFDLTIDYKGGSMPTDIFKEQVREMLEAGAQIVEVLSAKQYQERHITGAISLPLEEFDVESTKKLSNERPVITYCHDFQ